MLSKNFIFFLIYNFPLFSFKLEFETYSFKTALGVWSYNVPLFHSNQYFAIVL